MNSSVLGSTAVWLGLVFALTGAVNEGRGLAGRRSVSTRIFAHLTLLAVLGAVLVMQIALIRHDFSLAYVASNNATFTPLKIGRAHV